MTCQFLFRQRFRNPSGSFRNPHKKMTPCNLPATLPESFRKLPELQRNSKTVCNTSGNASGILPEASGTRVIRKLTKMNHFRQSPLFQVTEVIKSTQLKKLSKGFYDGHHMYIISIILYAYTVYVYCPVHQSQRPEPFVGNGSSGVFIPRWWA